MPDWITQWLESEPAPWLVVLCALGAGLVLQIFLKLIVRLTSRTGTDVDDQIVAALRRPLFHTVVLIGLWYALRWFEQPPSERTFGIIVALMVTLGVLIWTRALMRVGDAVLDMLARRVDDFQWIQPRSLPLYEILSKLLIVGSAAYALLLAWDVDLTAWLASAGILGLAIGFAAKDTLANFFAGIFILADAPYKLGDFIVIGEGERGKVTDIGIRSTRILTRDDIEVTLPNAVMANSKIVNETSGPHKMRRVRVDVGVAYGSDVDRVRKVLLDVAADCPLIVDAPEPSARFRAFGDSALDFQLRGWIAEPVLHGRAVDALCTAIYKRFLEEGIEIPFPQRVVHLEREPG